MEVYSGLIRLNGKGFLLSAIHDVSDKARLQRELLQREKMDALGFLAGGIAHDFNNLLTGIIGYSDLLAMEGLDEETRRDSMEQIMLSALKAKDLTQKILNYSRNKEKKRAPVSLVRAADECLEEKRLNLAGNIRIQKEYAGDGMVWANMSEIHQIFQNLVTNALYAMEEKGGILTIRIYPRRIDKEDMTAFKGIVQGGVPGS